MIYFLSILFVLYFAYTLNFAIRFNKTNAGLSANQKLLHHFLIWIIPFFWIAIVKTMITPIPGSGKDKKTRSDAGFYESGIGIWGHDDGNHFHVDDGSGDHGDD